jgi:hypothetical protein
MCPVIRIKVTIERLSSGRFASNSLALHLAVVTCNALRIGASAEP